MPPNAAWARLRLTVYTRWSPSPTLVLHIRLLARLLADYYEAKEREQEQRRNAYMHAIYETGSRLTHDVKNLLQSLRSLCAAVESSDEADAPALRRLLRRQLPQVAQRLQTTLDKLGRGAEAAQSTDTAGHWWRELQARYAHERILFESDPLPLELQIPADLFDRVAENCLQNALEKRRAAPQVQIRVRFVAVEEGLELTVSDSGEALPESLARTLFTAPVPSRQGLGVGLYQAARQAAALGYRLTSGREPSWPGLLSVAAGHQHERRHGSLPAATSWLNRSVGGIQTTTSSNSPPVPVALSEGAARPEGRRARNRVRILVVVRVWGGAGMVGAVGALDSGAQVARTMRENDGGHVGREIELAPRSGRAISRCADPPWK